ncbi:hypothetical protein SAMN06298212_10626 [Ruaniaceae bacterium KH17]|nr:hypothetical protein SAMN06298212_10626 [Ruaniaceae bacterium KH17]
MARGFLAQSSCVPGSCDCAQDDEAVGSLFLARWQVRGGQPDVVGEGLRIHERAANRAPLAVCPNGRAFLEPTLPGLMEELARERSLCVGDPPPRHSPAPSAHHGAHLARTGSHERGDQAVIGHTPWRDALRCSEDPFHQHLVHGASIRRRNHTQLPKRCPSERREAHRCTDLSRLWSWWPVAAGKVRHSDRDSGPPWAGDSIWQPFFRAGGVRCPARHVAGWAHEW